MLRYSIVDGVGSCRVSDLYLSFLRLLVTNQEVAAAENVWNRLVGLQQAFPPQLALPYFRLLIAKQEVLAAKTAWQQLSGVDASLRPYLPSSENLVINGGFEENLLNGGFDWWYPEPCRARSTAFAPGCLPFRPQTVSGRSAHGACRAAGRLLDPEDLLPPARQMEERRAAHSPHADHEHVVRHRWASLGNRPRLGPRYPGRRPVTRVSTPGTNS